MNSSPRETQNPENENCTGCRLWDRTHHKCKVDPGTPRPCDPGDPFWWLMEAPPQAQADLGGRVL
jgi:hypothetical protein